MDKARAPLICNALSFPSVLRFLREKGLSGDHPLHPGRRQEHEAPLAGRHGDLRCGKTNRCALLCFSLEKGAFPERNGLFPTTRQSLAEREVALDRKF